MNLSARLNRIDKIQADRFGKKFASLDDEGMVLELLKFLQQAWHEIHEEMVWEIILSTGGLEEDWEEPVRSALSQHCERLPGKKVRYRLKADHAK